MQKSPTEPRIKCQYCGTLDGYHLVSCISMVYSKELKKRLGIIVNKDGLAGKVKVAKS